MNVIKENNGFILGKETSTTNEEEKKGVKMTISRSLFEEALGQIQRCAFEMSAEEFFASLDELVENSRKFIDSFEDEETRGRLRDVYKGIVRYALDCKIKCAAQPAESKWN